MASKLLKRKTTIASLLIVSVLTLAACTAKDALLTGMDIARNGGNPGQAIQTRLRQKAESKTFQYATDPARIASDLEAARADFNKMMSILMQAVGAEWGGDAKGPTRKRYVKYVQNYKSRAMVDYDSGQRRITVTGKTRVVHYTEFTMVSDYLDKNARKYQPLAARYARQWGISQSLVLAVMRAESNFNPYATSHVPAYGLMQLVPATGGQDAYYHAKGVRRVPSKTYLYDPERNVELGTAYLHLLSTNHFKRVQNATSREYLVISGYNTGSSNVYRTFSADTTDAINAINSMQPPQVYRTLKQQLPYEETRN